MAQTPSGADRGAGGLSAAQVREHWPLPDDAGGLVVEVHRSVTSTNDLARADPRPWRVVVAEHQSAGRGRRGRRWESPPGAGLAVSVVVPASDAVVPGWLPLVAGVAMAEAVTAVTGVRTGLKWPNDLLVPVPPVTGPPGEPRWEKVCGVLAERAPDGAVVVVGAGLNVDHGAHRLPAGVSLVQAGARPDPTTRARLVAGYAAGLWALTRELARDGVGRGLRERYEAGSRTLGRRVVVHCPGGSRLTGTATSIAADGALRVRDDTGVVRTVHAGDVEHVRPGDGDDPPSGTLPG